MPVGTAYHIGVHKENTRMFATTALRGKIPLFRLSSAGMFFSMAEKMALMRLVVR
jgi:hypothetical protein